MSGNSIGDTVLASYSGLTVKAVIRFIGSVSFGMKYILSKF